MPNIQVTHGSSLNDARSESILAINPNNPAQAVGASRKCIDISAYVFTVATVYSADGEITWQDSAPLATPGWEGLSDPALAWDDSGNVFLIGHCRTACLTAEGAPRPGRESRHRDPSKAHFRHSGAQAFLLQ